MNGSQCSKGWGKRCANSKGKKCKCRCGGTNHGKNHHNEESSPRHNLSGETMEYLGYGIHESRCGVKIVRKENQTTVILTELPNNPGTSITNCFEDIATKIYKERFQHLEPTSIRWIENYPVEEGSIFHHEETFDEVTLEWDGNQYRHPHWKRIKFEEAA